MGKGNDRYAVQADRETVMDVGTSTSQAKESADWDHAENHRLLVLAQTGDEREAEAATEELLMRNAGLLRSIALRFRDRGVETEDLIQIGTVGMLKAIRGFDTERGTCFSTYAVPLIFGELRRHMRDEGPIKVGRYYKRLGVSLMNAKVSILAEEGRDPNISELAARCGVSAEEAAMALDSMSPILSLSDSAFGEEDGVELGSVLPDEESSHEIDRLCDRMALGQAVSKMPPLWQKLVMLRFYRNRTQQQTADALGLTQVKVSREEKKILAFLREELLK